MIFNRKKKEFLRIKKEIQKKDGNNNWFFIELEQIKSNIITNVGDNYSKKVADKNIERLQQLVWWLEDDV